MNEGLQTIQETIQMRNILVTISIAAVAMLSVACGGAGKQSITKQEVLDAQKAWADGIVAISAVFLEKGDYKARAEEHIKTLYAYDQGDVLFKPTLAAEDQFRETFSQALSYFVKGEIAEDGGFAIKPWSAARFGEQEIVFDSDSATAMGNYYFTPVGSDAETKVEYTIGYVKNSDGNVRICPAMFPNSKVYARETQ